MAAARTSPTFTPMPRQECHAPTRAGHKCRRYALPDNVFCKQHATIGRASFSVAGSFQAGSGLLWNNGTQPETVFHYTSVGALENILDSRVLWLSRYDHLNDPAEVSYGADRLIAAAWEFGGEHASLLSDSIGGLAEHLCNVFILSTSIHGDSLSLWNGYTGGDDGICIEFQPGAVRDMAIGAVSSTRVAPDVFRPVFFNDLFDVRAGRVLYDPGEQVIYARRAIEQCVAHLTNPDPGFQKVAGFFARDVLLTVILLFKEQCFRDENEYRICMVGREYEEDLVLLPKSRKCDWLEAGELPYIEVPIHLSAHPLKSIMSGPRFKGWDNTSENLRAMIERAGGDASLVVFPQSKIRLRF